jgi:outer membrane protein assembly factor BamD (BamD/ComL family)
VEEFEKVVEEYPEHEVSKKSLFMIAYIYNNYLEAYSDAIINYNLFKEKYPSDELIPSVEYELEGLKDIQATIDSLNSIVNKKTNL